MGTPNAPLSREPLGDNVGNAGSWYESLPDGFKSEKSLSTFKGQPIEKLVESYVNAQKSFGSRLPIPLPTDKPEERAAKIERLQEALGRPKSAADYKVELPAYEQLGLTHDAKQLEAFQGVAHKLGLSNEQVQALVNWQAESQAAAAPNHQAAMSDCITALRDGDENNPGWGTTMQKFVSIAKRAADAYFTSETQQLLEAQGLYNDPNFIRGMYKMGRSLIEDNVLVGEEIDSSGMTMTAQQELDKIMSDPKGPYFNQSHPDHDKMVERALDLRRFISRT